MATDGTPRLTPKIRALVATDRMDRPPPGRLTAAHVNALIAVATRPHEFVEPVRAYLAIQALAAGAKAEVSIPVLSEIASDRAKPSTDRVVAARELGRIATPEAESALVSLGRDRDPVVQQAVFAALGPFAGPGTLQGLDQLAEPGNLAARRQLALTRALIAHRYGLDGPFLPEVTGTTRDAVDPDEATTLTLRAKSEQATASDYRRMVGVGYGIELADRGLALMCGRSEWTVLLNRELGSWITPNERLFERPWIAAILARWFLEGHANGVQHLVLTRPVEGSARIDVVRRDGEVMYTGRAEPNTSGIAFSIADVDRPGSAATTMVGRMGPGGLQLEGTVASGKRTDTRKPEPVIQP